MAQTNAQADAVKFLIETKEKGLSPTIIFDNTPSISFDSGETLLGSVPKTTLQLPRAVRTSRGAYGGPSVRLAKGVSVRFAGYGSTSESHDEIRPADQGTLVVTDQRLIFIGVSRTISVPLEKVISVEAYSDALALHRQGKEKAEFFSFAPDVTVDVPKDGKLEIAPVNPAMVKIVIDHAISILRGVPQIERVYPAEGAQRKIQKAGKPAASTAGEATIMNLDPKVLEMAQEQPQCFEKQRPIFFDFSQKRMILHPT
jgi:hypothetical protein